METVRDQRRVQPQLETRHLIIHRQHICLQLFYEGQGMQYPQTFSLVKLYVTK